jgi:hypothetical protein
MAYRLDRNSLGSWGNRKRRVKSHPDYKMLAIFALLTEEKTNRYTSFSHQTILSKEQAKCGGKKIRPAAIFTH